MTYGTVCSGIEAPSVAWEPLGWTPAWFAEIAPFQSALLAHRFTGVKNHGDFTRLLREQPASVDVLCGGTPCQSFSVAGLRGGLSDPRGNLALAYVALAGLLRPRWVVWENVPGVLSADGGDAFRCLLSGLVEVGYGVCWRVLDAQWFGLAQRRERVFVVGYLGDWRAAAAVLFEPEGVRRDSPPRREAGARVAGALGTGTPEGGGWRVGADEAAAGHVVPVDLQNTTTGEDIAGTLDCSRPGRGGGQAVMLGEEPQAFWSTDSGRDGFTPPGLAPPLKVGSSGGGMPPPVAFQCHGSNVGPMGTVRAGNGGVTGGVPFVFEPRYYADRERMGGKPQELPSLRADMSKVGDSTPHVVAFQESQTGCREYASAGTLRASGPGHDPVGTRLRVGNMVRRLTPRECERLQGFPDDYTLVPYRGKPAADGHRYHALGNSMAVPVMAWIGRRLLLVGGAYSVTSTDAAHRTATADRSTVAMPWRLSWRADPDALPLANRHYNRQSPESAQFVPPGRCVVLTHGDVPGVTCDSDTEEE